MTQAVKRYRLLKHGGARETGGRLTTELTDKQCKALIDATQKAIDKGGPFNRFITILWERGGIVENEQVKATGRFIKSANDWLSCHNERLAWAWVREYGDTNRGHVHILLHVPPYLDPLFGRMPKRWVKAILDGVLPATILQTQKIRGAKNLELMSDLYRVSIMAKVHYMLKAAPARLEYELGMAGLGSKPWGVSCPVRGKRASIAQLLTR